MHRCNFCAKVAVCTSFKKGEAYTNKHKETLLMLKPNDSSKKYPNVLKVRQIQNDFFKTKFLQKKVRTNSTLQVFVFLEKSEDTKKTFRN